MRSVRLRRLRACAAVGAISLTLGVLGATATTTRADFTDDEYAKASIGTATLAAPTALTCTRTGGSLLASVFTFGWTGSTLPGVTYRYRITTTLGGGVALTNVAGSPAPPYSPGLLGLTITFSVQAVAGTVESAFATRAGTL